MEKQTTNKPTTFSKGQMVSVRYRKSDREFIGTYEVIRTGARFYLFNDHSGTDWHPTKKELEEAIENFKK